MTLTDKGQTHEKLDYNLGNIQTKNTEGQVLCELSPDELVMESTKFGKITPTKAIGLVTEYERENMTAQDSQVMETVLNFDECTKINWVVNVINSQTREILRTYTVGITSGELKPI